MNNLIGDAATNRAIPSTPPIPSVILAGAPMPGSSSISPFVYDSATLRVRSVDPVVTIVAEMFEGGSDGYEAYAVAISSGPSIYCFHAVHDYLRDESGKQLLTADRRPVGFQFMHVRTRWQFRDQRSGKVFASTFPDDKKSYQEAVALAVNFYSAAKMVRPDAPLRRIEFDSSERVELKAVEVNDAL